MSDAALRRAKLALGVSVLAVLVIATGLLAHASLFGSFSDYDDEGYMLLALRAWHEGNPLYDRIPTIYGPFYFQSVSALLALFHLPLDNCGARWFALGTWIAASLLCGAWSWRAHRSFLAALLAWALAFRTLTLIAKEPLHPGDLIVLLLAVAAHVALGLSARRQRLATWAILGALAAAIGLTKMNVGAFLVLALLGTWARFAEGRRGLLIGRSAIALALVLVPFVLVRGLLGATWARDFAVLVSASLLPFGILLFRRPGADPWRLAPLLALVVGGAALTLASIGMLFATGTTPGGLWRELVLAAVRFPAQTWLEPELPPSWSVLAALALVPVGLYLRARTSEKGRAVFAALRGAAAAHTLVRCALRSMPMASLPFLWLLAMPGPESERSPRERPFFFLALAVCLQSLHAFPVAGSQVAFFAFLLPLVAIGGLAAAWRDVPASWRERVPAVMRNEGVALAAAGAVVLVTAFYPGWKLVPDRWREYRETEVDLELPGTELMRLPEKRAAAYAWAAANVRRSADAFLGMPGKHSLHIWSGVPSPVPFYPAAWPLFYGEKEQQQLADALLAHARPCIVRTPYALEAWRRGRGLVDRAIQRTIDERFRVAGSAFGIEILLPKEDRTELVLTARRTDIPASLASVAQESVALRLCLPELDGVEITRLSLVDADRGSIVYDTAGEGGVPRMRIAEPTGGLLLDPLAISLRGRRDLIAFCPRSFRVDGETAYLVRASTADGRVVARLPLNRSE